MIKQGHDLAEAAKRGDAADFANIYDRCNTSINLRLGDGEVCLCCLV